MRKIIPSAVTKQPATKLAKLRVLHSMTKPTTMNTIATNIVQLAPSVVVRFRFVSYLILYKDKSKQKHPGLRVFFVVELGFGVDCVFLQFGLELGSFGVFLVGALGSGLGVLGGLGLAGLKLVDAAGGVDELLLTGVERVAVGANFHRNVLHGRMSREGGVATVAVNGSLEDLGVNGGFHN
jgi:hypothetical protein